MGGSSHSVLWTRGNDLNWSSNCFLLFDFFSNTTGSNMKIICTKYTFTHFFRRCRSVNFRLGSSVKSHKKDKELNVNYSNKKFWGDHDLPRYKRRGYIKKNERSCGFDSISLEKKKVSTNWVINCIKFQRNNGVSILSTEMLSSIINYSRGMSIKFQERRGKSWHIVNNT